MYVNCDNWRYPIETRHNYLANIKKPLTESVLFLNVKGQLLNTKSTAANELLWYLRRIIYSPQTAADTLFWCHCLRHHVAESLLQVDFALQPLEHNRLCSSARDRCPRMLWPGIPTFHTALISLTPRLRVCCTAYPRCTACVLVGFERVIFCVTFVRS